MRKKARNRNRSGETVSEDLREKHKASDYLVLTHFASSLGAAPSLFIFTRTYQDRPQAMQLNARTMATMHRAAAALTVPQRPKDAMDSSLGIAKACRPDEGSSEIKEAEEDEDEDEAMPTSPEDPAFPTWPICPVSPGAPSPPEGPGGPRAPSLPFLPSMPVLPRSPSFPSLPIAPSGPMSVAMGVLKAMPPRVMEYLALR
mmetsp:Transcript_13136/g.19909  ORF Transcript_13136/g.19909 Transcript_13136/m.19909 type:complete len:201 (-) Transcript_13136:263-865(-)